MRQNAGIVRFDVDLRKAKEQLMQWQDELETILKNNQISTELYELCNMITIGNLIVQHSIERKENCGGFVKFAPSYSYRKKKLNY
jgi:L-aspartate oxidase